MRLFFKSFGHFALYSAINPHNLPNRTILYTLQYFNLSRNICGKHWFWGKNDKFCCYPLSEHGWRAIKQMRAPFESTIACISVNEESLGYDTMSYQHFLRIKYHFYEKYFTVKSAKMLFYQHIVTFTLSFIIIYRIMHSCFIFNGFQCC